MLAEYPWASELWDERQSALGDGPLIVVEGPHGAGKSTTVKALATTLAARGIECLATKEPTSTELGDFVKAASEWIRGAALAALIAADRWYHVETEITPTVAQGAVVISDRYVPSSLVLQTLDSVPLSYIVALNREFPTPTLTVFLDCPREVLLRRRSARLGSTRFEREGDSEQEAKLYQAVADQLGECCGDRIIRFDSATTPPLEIAAAVASRVQAMRAPTAS